ncbi:MAG: hypothetical protein ACPLZB_01025 [Caldisericaceae bacterium]
MENDFTALIAPLRSSFLGGLFEQLKTIYLVGGALRDFLLGLPVTDYDFVVPYSEVDLIASYLGTNKIKYFFLSKGRIRLLRAINDGIEYDFMPIDAPIEKDMNRRDFTINSIYYNLKDNTLYMNYNALNDIENRTLRAISSSSIEDDPVRILRAIRFASCLGFSVEHDTEFFIRGAVKLVPSVKKERAREEIKKIFKCDFDKTTAVLGTLFNIQTSEIIEKFNVFAQCPILQSQVNEGVSYASLGYVSLIEKQLPIFAFAFEGNERRIIKGILEERKDLSFEELFKCFLTTDAKVLITSIFVSSPHDVGIRLCTALTRWSGVKIKGSEIKRAAYEFGIPLREARIELLREQCKKIYDEV